MLEVALEHHAELSDQLLLHVFLRLPLWARAISREGDEASLTVPQLHPNPKPEPQRSPTPTPTSNPNPNPNPSPSPNPNPNPNPNQVRQLMRQLHRMVGERPAQWQRTAALCRLLDAMHEAFPWPAAAASHVDRGGRGDRGGKAGKSDAADKDGRGVSGGGGGGGGGGGSGRARRHSEAQLAGVWAMAMDVLRSALDTPRGVSRAHLRYVVHSMLRHGGCGVHAALLRLLLERTFAHHDLRVVTTLLEGGASSLMHCLLPLMQGGRAGSGSATDDGAVGGEGREGREGVLSEADVQLLVLKLVGRVLCLAHGTEATRGGAGHGGGGGGGSGGGSGGGGADGSGGGDPTGRSGPMAASVKLPAAKRWVEQHWGRGGWAWLTAMLGSAPPTSALIEALTQVLLGTISLAMGPGVITSGAGRGPQGTNAPRAGVRRAWSEAASEASEASEAPQRSKMRGSKRSIAADEHAHRFVHAPALLPLLQLCAAAPPPLQHSVLLSMTLWLQHSTDDANPLQLAQQFGWQLPLCSMLNGMAGHGSHQAPGTHDDHSSLQAPGSDQDRGSHDDRGSHEASHAFCVQLLLVHMMSALKQPDGFASLQQTVTFIETYTVDPP